MCLMNEDTQWVAEALAVAYSRTQSQQAFSLGAQNVQGHQVVLDHMLTAAQETGLAEEWYLSLLCGDQWKKMVSYSPGWLKRVK